MSLSIDARIGALPNVPDDDSFSKKVGQWAYSATFPAAKFVIEEIQGRFGVGPLDGVALTFLENRVAPLNHLPVGSRYDYVLEQMADKFKGTPVGDILKEDVALRTYFVGRRMGEMYS